MYYCVGWPRLGKLPQKDPAPPIRVCCNRDHILVAVLTTDSVVIWYCKPCVPIISHRRSEESLSELGQNLMLTWKPDSSMIAVATAGGHIIFYNIVVYTEVKSLYEQVDPANPALRRESAELYFKENVPPLIFSQAFEVSVPGGVTDMVTIRDQLMISTKDGHILRYHWDGQLHRDYCLDLRRIPFCMDQQVMRAVPLVEKSHVVSLAYSPLLGGFAIVLSDGRAAFLVATTLKFDPNSVQGIWAGGVEDVTCTALNHKFRLMAFGRNNSQGVVYSIDESTGGLEVSHRLILPTKDYPGCPGPVTGLRWTPDSTCLALVWAGGGFSIWSTFGTMILCSLGWDHGPTINDPIKQAPYNILDMDWSGEGYQLWVINSSTRRFTGDQDKDFCPFPKEEEEKEKPSHLGNNVLIIPFIKSPLSVNPAMSAYDNLYLQGEDRLYLNSNDHASPSLNGTAGTTAGPPWSSNPRASASKQWSVVTIPHTYISSSWPIRYTAMDDSCSSVAVAGRAGLAFYSVLNRKWKLFGNETQEKEFIVTGGLLWWREFLVIGCYNLISNRDEVRVYPRDSRLDTSLASTELVEAQVLLLNRLEDRLIVYCANSHISLYDMYTEVANPMLVKLKKVQDVDAGLLAVHPACVVSVSLTHLKTESLRQRKESERESVERSTMAPSEAASLILNVSGKLVLVQRERTNNNDLLYSAPTVLAGQCEQVWLPGKASNQKPHLTLALWLYCGAAGMRVWLPLFPKEGESQHSFMARRIMLHFPLLNIYPLSIMFEEAIIVGAENDTQLLPGEKVGPAALPFCTLERVSQVYLHQLLRQLIRRNLGHHAWDIANSCSGLPYFQHSLELLLHSVLEEEATSKEPIPDALLPSVVDFIRSFPVYRETVVRCTRKSEVALWPYLFAAVGSARELFCECLDDGELTTAASYLIILQSLEPSSTAKQYATQLLDAALERGAWDLAKDLVRFLRAIDPSECDEDDDAAFGGATANSFNASSNSGSATGGVSPRVSVGAAGATVSRPPGFQSSPLSPSAAQEAGEEDLSLVLGTLMVPRSRAVNVGSLGASAGGNKNTTSSASAGNDHHPTLSRSISDRATPATSRLRKMSSSSSPNTAKDTSGSSVGGCGTAEHYFIDTILARHARKLLSAGCLRDLGKFSAQLDFHLVAWLRREANRAAQLDDFVWALRRIHLDMGWPWPDSGQQPHHSLSGLMPAGGSGGAGASVGEPSRTPSTVSSLPPAGGELPKAAPIVDGDATAPHIIADKLDELYIECDGDNNKVAGKHNHNGMAGHHQQRGTGNAVNNDSSGTATESGYGSSSVDRHVSEHSLISEQAVDAMLRVRDRPNDQLSVLSEDVDIASVCDGGGPVLTNNYPPIAHSDLPPKREVQLRYFLQIMVEASCLEWAAVVSVVLRDAMAVIRIVNAARSASDAPFVVRRLYDGLIQLDSYAQHLCLGYRPFLNTIQPQIRSLAKFLANSVSETQPQQAKTSLNSVNGGAVPASKISTNSAPGGYTNPLGRLRLLTASPTVGSVPPAPAGKYPLPRSLSDPMTLKAAVGRDADCHGNSPDDKDESGRRDEAKRSLDSNRASVSGVQPDGRKHGVHLASAASTRSLSEVSAENSFHPDEEAAAGCVLS